MVHVNYIFIIMFQHNAKIIQLNFIQANAFDCIQYKLYYKQVNVLNP